MNDSDKEKSPTPYLFWGTIWTIGPLTYLILLSTGVIPDLSSTALGFLTSGPTVLGSLFGIPFGAAVFGKGLQLHLENANREGKDSLLVRMNSVKMSPALAVIIVIVLGAIFSLVAPLFM